MFESWNAAKTGYQCICACKRINISLSENSIFIMNVEQYLLRFSRKRLPETRLDCFFFMHIRFGDEKKDVIYN